MASATNITQSDAIQYSDDAQAVALNIYTPTTPKLVKTIVVNHSYIGSWRIVFDLGSDSSFVGTINQKIYINGAAVGTLRSVVNGTGTYTTFTENFTNITIFSGDNIQLFGWVGSGYSGGTAKVKNFRIKFDINQIPYLNAPLNGSVQTKAYPPLTVPVNFTWDESYLYNSYFLIAKDSNFDLITKDIITSNNYSVQSLEAGSYWWKVRYYNSTSGTYGNYSDTFNFTLTSNVSTTGTGIHGVVYELNGAQTPLSEATVYIQHSAGNWSSQMTTGSNGYYLFSNLSNNTVYYVYAVKKDYQNSATEYITTGSGNITTRDILLRPTEPTDFESDKQYVKFSARWLWCLFNCNIEGATISAYNYGDVIAYASGVTDSTGSVSYRLYKTQRYRVTVVNSTAGISQEMTLYPKDSEYVFLITNAGKTMQEHDVQQKDAIKIAVSKSIIDSTNATITVNYTDSLAGTTALTYYINQSNATVVQSWTWAAGTYNHTFTISGYSGQSYMVHVVASHAVYGTIDRSYAVPFEKTAGVGIDGIPATLWLWFAIGIMFFTGAMFTASTVEKGLLIVVAEGWIFFFMGMFSTIDPVQFSISLTLASVIAVFAYIRRAQASEGLA